MAIQEISPVPEAGHRGVDIQTTFVGKQETFQDHLRVTLVPELNQYAQDVSAIAQNTINAITFDNIAQLRLHSNIRRVDVLGYYTKGDGGGDTFYWDATSTDTDDGGYTIQATGVAPGRWKRPLGDIVDIRKYGGIDDDDGSLTTVNSKASFAKAFQYLNSIGGGTLYLPKTKTGGYFINGDDTTPITSNIKIVADEGVYLRIIYSGGISNSPFANNNLKYNRELKKIMQNFGFTSYGYSDVLPKPSEHLNTLTQKSGILSIPKVLSGNDFKIMDFSNTNAVVAPIGVSGNAISFNANSKTIGAVKHAKIGDEIFGLLSASAGGYFFVGVVTMSGFAIVKQHNETQEVSLDEQNIGTSPILKGIQYSSMNQQRDLFNNSLMSIKILSARTFQVLCNGLVISTHTARSNILGVAFGAENINDTIFFSQMSVVSGNSLGGSKPLKIIGCGDSISDNNVQYSQYRIMASILQSAGIQLETLNNIAVAGETSGQQLARLQLIDAGYDYILIQVGVNDIQGGVSFETFVSNITAMINHAKSVGATPIVGIPTGFYSLAEAQANGQSGGQNTTNNTSIHTYRALLIRAVADAGALINLQSFKNYGAITAKWLSTTDADLVIDPILTDNIHPTPYGAKQLGLSWAETIIGAIHSPDISISQPFEEIPTSWLKNGFGTVQRPYIRGNILKGVIDLTGGSNAEANPFMQLPPHFRVSETAMFPVVCINSSGLPIGISTMYIGIDGNCYGFNLVNGVNRLELGHIDLTDYLV